MSKRPKIELGVNFPAEALAEMNSGLEQRQAEAVEDYCIRAAAVYPWALEAGTTIKFLKSRVSQLEQQLAAAERANASLQLTLDCRDAEGGP